MITINFYNINIYSINIYQPNLLPYIQVDPVLPNQHNNLEENAEQQIHEVPADGRDD